MITQSLTIGFLHFKHKYTPTFHLLNKYNIIWYYTFFFMQCVSVEIKVLVITAEVGSDHWGRFRVTIKDTGIYIINLLSGAYIFKITFGIHYVVKLGKG